MRTKLALTGLLLVAALAGAPSRAAASEATFCKNARLHDYLAPLKRMPKLRELPFRARGEGRFRGVHIGSSGPALAVNGGSAGYQFQWEKNPRWDVTVTLARVSPTGRVLQGLGQRHLRLGSLAPAIITEPRFGLPRKPAIYRTTLLIRTASGHKLAEFGNYYRVVRPTVQARLVPDAVTYRPGSTLLARLENPGASFTLFGEEYSIEALAGEGWAPAAGLPEVFNTGLHFVAPGTISPHCIVFPIPASLPAGTYRVAQEAVITWPGQPKQQRPFLYAKFKVAPQRPPPSGGLGPL